MRGLGTAAFIALLGVSVPWMATAVPQAESLDGQLTIVWADPRPGTEASAGTEYWLNQRGDRRVRLEVPPLAAGAMHRLDRQWVRVRGQPRPDRAAAGRTYPAFRVERVDPLGAHPAASGSAGGSAALQPGVTGRQPWVNLLCAFPDQGTDMLEPAYFTRMFSSTKPGLDYYWKELSHSQYSVAGSIVKGWYTLPQPYSAYVRGGYPDWLALLEDCTGVADNDVNFPDFAGINLIVNHSLGCCAWGGGGVVSRDGVSRIYGVTWMPDWGWRNHGVFGHEMGHGIGLPHSRGYVTYRNLWDVMSDLWYACHLATDPVLGCLGQHTIGFHKDKLGWIPETARYVLEPGTVATVHLDKLERPSQPGARQLAVIPILGNRDHFYTVEVRRKYGFDAKLPGASVVVHEVDLRHGEPANVVDGDANGDAYDAGTRWLPGETFADRRGTRITVDQADGVAGYYVTLQSSFGPIFADDFESGDLLRWSGGKLDDGDVAVTTDAAMLGGMGLRVQIDDNNQAHLTDHTPEAVRNYLARFRFNPNALAMANGDRFTIFGAYTAGPAVATVELVGAPGGYQMRALTRLDDGTSLSTPWVYLVYNYPYEIQLEWQAATAPGMADGGLKFMINGQPYGDYAGLDNDTLRIERSLLGAVTGIDSGTRGTIYFDEFMSAKW